MNLLEDGSGVYLRYRRMRKIVQSTAVAFYGSRSVLFVCVASRRRELL
jgi:hypothetical protein